MRRVIWIMTAIFSAWQAAALLPLNEFGSSYISYYMLNPFKFFATSVFLLFSILILSYTFRETLGLLFRKKSFILALIDFIIAIGGVIYLSWHSLFISGLIIGCTILHLLLSVEKVKEKQRQNG